MATLPTISRYIRQQHDICIAGIEDFCTSHSAEALHQLRVAIKKLKALLQLRPHNISKKQAQKVYAPLKDVFKQAGVIREAQLNAARFKQLHLDKTKQVQLQEEIALHTRVFIENMFKHFYRVYTSQVKFLRLFKPITSKQVIKNHKRTLKKVRMHSLTLNPGSLHNFRKKLKVIKYNAAVCNTKLILQQKAAVVLKQAEGLQQQIGNWHDEEVLMALLSRYKGHTRQIQALKSNNQKLYGIIVQQAITLYKLL